MGGLAVARALGAPSSLESVLLASFLLSHSSFANTFGSESRLAVAWLPGLPSLSKRVRLDRAPNKSVMST